MLLQNACEVIPTSFVHILYTYILYCNDIVNNICYTHELLAQFLCGSRQSVY